MKYSEAINITISLTQNTFMCNEPIRGELTIKNNYDATILIKNILVNLMLKHQGRGETGTYNIERITISDYRSIKAGEIITHQFAFDPIYNVTYIGENVTQNIIVKTKVDIKSESEKELRNQAISNLKIGSFFRGVFKPDFYNEKVVKIIRGNVNYEIKNAEGSIILGIKKVITILGVSLLALIILSFMFYHNINEQIEVFYVALSIFLILLGFLYVFKISPSLKIGKIKYKLNNIEGNFYEAILNFEKRSRNIKEIKCQLFAIEKVTYDNGSSRSTATKTFYKSDLYTIKRFGKSIKEEIELPKVSLPKTLNNGDFEIIWKFNIIVTTDRNLNLIGTSEINLGFEKTDIPIDIKEINFM